MKALFLCLALFANFAYGDLNQLLQSFTSLQANFTETVQNGQGHGNMSQGTLMILKPNQFNWHILSPNEEWYISNGKQVWNVEPDLQQVTITPLGHNLSTTPLLLLGGEVQDINTLFAVTIIDANDYVLVPKDPNSMIKKIKLSFDASGKIQLLEITNTLGQVSTLKFSNVKLNAVINARQFQYVVPVGMDVLS
ncbi:MAG: outer membrane lipoprotein chaperone LolA [Gammaproteobacteria bacterium]|jgi:outer membrane lipoprotein carrier protein|nr:outer membrane lipoprotein chaperone LolA [Gammaproteobacteria bacterium]